MNYPFIYPNNLAAHWTVVVGEGSYIELTFIEMDIGSQDSRCQQDYITVRDTTYSGEETGEPQIFCNHIKPAHGIVSSWHYLSVRFLSDSVIQGTGFIAKYESRIFIIGNLRKKIFYNGE